MPAREEFFRLSGFLLLLLMSYTIFCTFSCVSGFSDAGSETGSAGFTMAGGSSTTGT